MGKICLSSKPTYPIYSRGFLPTQTPRLAIGGLHAALRAVGLGQHRSFMTLFLKFLTTIQLFSLQTKSPTCSWASRGFFVVFVNLLMLRTLGHGFYGLDTDVRK